MVLLGSAVYLLAVSWQLGAVVLAGLRVLKGLGWRPPGRPATAR